MDPTELIWQPEVARQNARVNGISRAVLALRKRNAERIIEIAKKYFPYYEDPLIGEEAVGLTREFIKSDPAKSVVLVVEATVYAKQFSTLDVFDRVGARYHPRVIPVMLIDSVLADTRGLDGQGPACLRRNAEIRNIITIFATGETFFEETDAVFSQLI